MAALTTQQEYDAIREAIQTLTASGQSTVSVSVDGMSVSYNASQMTQLAEREVVLANRICNKNRRKRVIPGFDFT
jgi:hypothetical protein